MKLVLKELRESQTWLRYSQRMQLVSADEVEPHLQECDELIAIFVASIRTAKKNREYPILNIQYSFTRTATPASDPPVTP